jgi:hypothetical protein
MRFYPLFSPTQFADEPFNLSETVAVNAGVGWKYRANGFD